MSATVGVAHRPARSLKGRAFLPCVAGLAWIERWSLAVTVGQTPTAKAVIVLRAAGSSPAKSGRLSGSLDREDEEPFAFMREPEFLRCEKSSLNLETQSA